MKFKSIVYLSTVDIFEPKGPSVNELEFLKSLELNDITYQAYVGSSLLSICQQSFLNKSNLYSVSGGFRYGKFLRWLMSEARVLFALLSLRRDTRPKIMRIGPFPLALFLFAGLNTSYLHIKTIGDGNFMYLNRSILGRIIRPIAIILYRRILKYTDSVDMVTDRHRDEFINNFYFSRCFVVDNKVNLTLFQSNRLTKIKMRKKLSIPKDSFVIGYVGNDPSRRGALECIRVLNVIQEVDNRPLYVLIVGPNDTMMSSHISHSIIERVIFVDSISYFDVPAYMDVIDVGFSILPPHHRGASEQKVRQYMALGIPAIVTPGGSSFVSDAKAGIIIENGYIEEILEALGTISNDYSFYSNNAQRYAQMNLDSKDLSLERMKIIELCKN